MFGKWTLLVKTIPVAFLVLGARWAAHSFFGFDGIVDFSDISMVTTGGIFLIGLMLSGVMADYKESEKLPGEVACTLESVYVTFEVAGECRPLTNRDESKAATMDLAHGILKWLHRKIDQETLFSLLSKVELQAIAADKGGAGPYANRVLSELTGLRKLLTRMAYISRTNFLPAGYALLQVASTIILMLLVIAKFKSVLAETVLVSFVSIIYVYMINLISDIDDPFEYQDEEATGSAEVALFPISEFISRVEKNNVAQTNNVFSKAA